MTAAADRTPAAIAVAIVDAEDAGGGAVDAVAVEVEDARKAAAIFLLQNMPLLKAINARTTRAASKAALSSRATIAARKARATAHRPLRQVPVKTKLYCRANPWQSTVTSPLLPQQLPPCLPS